MNIHHHDIRAKVLDDIGLKRSGRKLTDAQIQTSVQAFISQTVPDYQISAWLATVACTGLDVDEVVALTRAYLGDQPVSRPADLPCTIVDKHSTGGVGDKTTLIVCPLLAACGVPIAKLSGRGLGFAGGTIDKLESVENLRLTLDRAAVNKTLKNCGMVIASANDDLAPGDKATYRIRDVSGTVESIPLIAASIMAKKIAFGADALILDVKFGDGALIRDFAHASQLAELMQFIADGFGIRAKSILSDMNQPLGSMVGNRCEISEAIAVLKGEDRQGLKTLCIALAAEAYHLAHGDVTLQEAEKKVSRVLNSGNAFEFLSRWARAQGATPHALHEIEQCPLAKSHTVVTASNEGWMDSIPARAVGQAGLTIGMGKLSQTDKIDPYAGISLLKRVGDPVSKGEPLAIIYSDNTDHAAAKRILEGSTSISNEQVPPISVLAD